MRFQGRKFGFSVVTAFILSALIGAAHAVAGSKPPPPPPPAHDAYVFCTWANASDGNHNAISGESVDLRAVVKSTSENLTYLWEFGDGASDSGTVTNPYIIKVSHTYTGAVGAIFTAKLTVSDNGAFLGSDTYKVVLAAVSRDTRKLIAIERGLWTLHSQIVRGTGTNSAGVLYPRGLILNEDSWDGPLATMTAGTAFAENGFKATGSANNPYTEDMQRLVNYVTGSLAIVNIGVKGGGALTPLNPENRSGAVIDGYAVYFSHRGEQEYQMGIALRLLANSGYTTQKPAAYDDALDYTGAAVSIKNWTYAEIIQQMIDFFAWAQLYDQGMDYGTAPVARNASMVVPTDKRGSWTYWSDGWRYDSSNNYINGAYGDTAIAYWVVSGLKAAQKMGCVWPAFVKTELDGFLQKNQDTNSRSAYYGEFHFGEAYGHHLVERAGQGLTLLAWSGVSTSNTRVTSAKNYISKYWNNNNYNHEENYPDSSRGFNGCTYTNGTAGDCFSHWETGTYEAGYYELKIGLKCDQYACAQEPCAEGTTCLEYGCYPGYCSENDPGCYQPDPSDPNKCLQGGCATPTPYCTGYDWNICQNPDCYLYNCARFDTTTCIDPKGFYPAMIDRVWVSQGMKDTTNLFGFLTVTEGLQAIGVTTGFPKTDPYRERYIDLLVANQLENGSWNDRGWVYDSPYGTSWALMVLGKF